MRCRCRIGEKRPGRPPCGCPGRSDNARASQARGGRNAAGVFITQRMADTARVIQQWAGDELRRSSGDLLRQPGELTLRPGTHIELPPAAGLVTQRRRHGTGQRSGGGKRPHPGRGHPPRTQIALPRQRARPHPAATTPLTRPTPAPAAAATPRQTSARRAGDRDARQRPAHDRPPPLLRPRPAGRHHCAARHSHHQYAPASLPAAGTMLAVTRKHQGTSASNQPPTAHPIRSPNRDAGTRLPGGSREQDRPPEP
jgi:hypothetical protein